MQLKGIEAGKQSRHSNFVQLPSPWKRASDETHNTARANTRQPVPLACIQHYFPFLYNIVFLVACAQVGVITVYDNIIPFYSR